MLSAGTVSAQYPDSGTLLTFDAAGLGLFSVTGTVKALDFDAHPVSAVALGVTTAVGGGMLRDIAGREVPSLFRHNDVYALPAFAGATAMVVLAEFDLVNTATGVVAAVLTFALRVLALR